jgi:hypothetical protein
MNLPGMHAPIGKKDREGAVGRNRTRQIADDSRLVLGLFGKLSTSRGTRPMASFGRELGLRIDQLRRQVAKTFDSLPIIQGRK